MSTERCIHRDCVYKNKRFKSFGLRQHWSVSHPDDNPSSYLDPGQPEQLSISTHKLKKPRTDLSANNDMRSVDDSDVFLLGYSTATPLNKTSNAEAKLIKKSVGRPVVYGDRPLILHAPHGKMTDIEYMAAMFAMENNLSNKAYKEHIYLLETTAQRSGSKKQLFKCRSIKELRDQLIKDADECGLTPFSDYLINLEDVVDFPLGRVQEFQDAVGPLYFSCRDIHDLTQHLFAHPRFWECMNLTPEIHTRNGERVFSDFSTGTWWEKTQLKFPGYVVLPLMLASDQTLVSVNARHKAWPVYLKLGNIPAKVREQKVAHATRVLGLLPAIEWKPQAGTTAPIWFSVAKNAIVHHCMTLMLKKFRNVDSESSIRSFRMTGPHGQQYQCIPVVSCYIADFPEQKLLANVKGTLSGRPCPRCKIPASEFHLFCSEEKLNKLTRSAHDTKNAYYRAVNMIKTGDKAGADSLMAENSTQLVKNAFWDIPLVDIHAALTTDDLHQLGGVYRHLLDCVDSIFLSMPDGKKKIKIISERASLIPPFQSMHPFKRGFMLSSLKNPTFSELKDHMGILMCCVHDLVPLQVAVCIRHFIDFFFQATAKEHSESTLTDMEESLRLYHKYSRIFERWSKSKMRFPKNHMLSKYCGDIRRYGVVAGYSTSSSERQHRYDAKAPAKHVNFSSTTFIHQLSTYIFYRDLLDDQYYHLKPLAQPPSQTAAAASSSEKQLYPTFSLRSCRNNGAPISFNDLKNQKGMFRRLKTLLRTELDYQDGRMSSVAVKNLPRVEDKIVVYNALMITAVDVDGDQYSYTIRAYPQFRGVDQFDFVQLQNSHDKDIFAQVHLLFKARRVVDGQRMAPTDFCYVELFRHADKRHASGLQVLLPPEVGHTAFAVFPVSRIKMQVHIVPDFSTALNDDQKGPYEQYLINRDANILQWAYGQSNLPELGEEYVGWTDREDESDNGN